MSFRDKVKLDCSVTHSSSEDTVGIVQSLEGTEAEEDRTDVSSYATAGKRKLKFYTINSVIRIRTDPHKDMPTGSDPDPGGKKA